MIARDVSVSPPRRTVLMRSLLAAIDRLCALGGALACACLVVVVGLVLTEVFCRKFLGLSLDFAWEWATYLTAVTFTLGMGRALRFGQHVRVRMMLDMLAPRQAHIADAVSVAVALALALVFTWAIGHLAWVSRTDGTRSFLPSNTLLWPFQVAFAAGGALLALQLLAYLLRLLTNEAPEQASANAPLERVD